MFLEWKSELLNSHLGENTCIIKHFILIINNYEKVVVVAI